MASWKLRADPTCNRLYGELEGFFTAEEMKKCADETIEATKEIERVQAHFRKSGARQGVRIVGGTVLSGMQFRRTGGETEWNSVNLPSLEEAEKFLDDLK
jgi:hypothetical protein